MLASCCCFLLLFLLFFVVVVCFFFVLFFFFFWGGGCWKFEKGESFLKLKSHVVDSADPDQTPQNCYTVRKR